MQNDMFLNAGATFSKCKKHRTDLWRVWNPGGECATFILLNPSTADEWKNDPTVTRCQRYAERWGYGGLHVLNIFSFRSTDPHALYKMSLDDISNFDDNMKDIIRVVKFSGVVVCGWGNHAREIFPGYPRIFTNRIRNETGVELKALKINKGGSPQHPLYLKGDLLPKHFDL